MNAGAHGKEIKDIIKTVKCVDYQGNEKEFLKEELEFDYRTSRFKKEKQPIEMPSAGSTFKRGADFITAKLIEEAGLKGYRVGDAEVSVKHSGFVVNKGNATAKDVLALVEKIQKTVYEKFSKKIELEIEVIGEK